MLTLGASDVVCGAGPPRGLHFSVIGLRWPEEEEGGAGGAMPFFQAGASGMVGFGAAGAGLASALGDVLASALGDVLALI